MKWFSTTRMNFTAEQIAQVLQGIVEGNPKAEVKSFAKIEEGEIGSLSFLYDSKYEHYIYSTKSTIVLVNQDFMPSQPVSATLIRVPDARESVGRLMAMVQTVVKPRSGVHPTAYIAKTAKVSTNCYIGPFVCIGENVEVGEGTQVYAHCVIEENSKVGSHCLFYPHVSVYHDCVIGNQVILHSGCVVGADGFGFAPTEGGYEKIPQIGNVVIEDNVEIGANSCVDRAVMGSTVIHHGVKLDNLVQIAHNCEVGAHSVMSSQTGVAGSSKVGEWCMFGGQVGIGGHISIADRTKCGAQAGVANSVKKSDQSIIGSPAMDFKIFAKGMAVFKKLPQMYIDVNRLVKKERESE